jgi:hypothetical protein
MKAHVQNPWTRSPQLFVHMTVEEVQQLVAALDACMPSAAGTAMSDNAFAALTDLRHQLLWSLQRDRPHGIKDVEP